MKPILRAVWILVVSLGLVSADLVEEVPRSERDELAAGTTIVKSTPVPGLPWPALSLYRVVNAPPSVVANLFTDYAAAPLYTPGLLSADAIATNPDGSKDVRYTVKNQLRCSQYLHAGRR